MNLKQNWCYICVGYYYYSLIMNQLTSIDLSKLIISYLNDKGDIVTNKKLQKLLYFSNAWHMAYFDIPLIKDEEPQAWRFGPVYVMSYNKYKKSRYQPINIDKDYKKFSNSPFEFFNSIINENNISNDQKELIEKVLLKYGGFSAYELEIVSHNEKPWKHAREGCGEFENCANIISNDIIKETYLERIESK